MDDLFRPLRSYVSPGDYQGNADFLASQMNAIVAFLNSGWATLIAIVWLIVIVLGGHTWVIGGVRRLLRLGVPANGQEPWRPDGLTPIAIGELLNHLGLLFRSEVAAVHFDGVWSDAPHVVFTIKVWNASPFDIDLSGVKGSVRVNETGCTSDAKIPGDVTVTVPKYVDPYYELRVMQPLGDGHAKAIQAKLATGEAIPFDLKRLHWVGKVKAPDTLPLPDRVSCGSTFSVDGTGITAQHPTAKGLCLVSPSCPVPPGSAPNVGPIGGGRD